MAISAYVSDLVDDVFLFLNGILDTLFGSVQKDLEDAASKATSYQEWLVYQSQLDTLSLQDDWRSVDQDPAYDWLRLRKHVTELEKLQRSGNSQALAHYVRFHASRNDCKILTQSLYRKSAASTKALIERYIRDLRSTIIYLGAAETRPLGPGFTSQEKFQVFNDVRQTLGRTSLVLQGGSGFSMCHLGVVRGLHKTHLLPKIITGTGTGAIVAALAGIHPDHQLLDKLAADSIDLSAFTSGKLERDKRRTSKSWYESEAWSTFIRRAHRYIRTRHIFDSSVLEQCIQDNLGDLTFEDAYKKTGRVLNITVALPNTVGVPQLFNYITAPHVIIWSAVMGSIATSKLYTRVNIWCKAANGERQPYFAPDSIPYDWKRRSDQPQEAPLQRIGELFNVNHFVVSQTRPYVIPFIWLQRPGTGLTGAIKWWLRWAVHELFHVLLILNDMGLTFQWIERLLMDELIPTTTPWSKIVITPDLYLRDIFSIISIPDARTLEKWILRGERSVWPAVCELQVRCGVEYELDKAYERVRRRTSPDLPNGIAETVQRNSTTPG